MAYETFISQMRPKVLRPKGAQKILPPLSELTDLTYAVYTESGVPQNTLHPFQADSKFVIIEPPFDQVPLLKKTAISLTKRAKEGTLKRESAILYNLMAQLLLHTSVSGFSRIQVTQGVPPEVRELLNCPNWDTIIPSNIAVAYLSQLTIHPLLPGEIKVAIHNRLLATDLEIAKSSQCSQVLSIMKPHVVIHVQEAGMTATLLPGPTLNWEKSSQLFSSYPYYWTSRDQPQLYAITAKNNHA